MIQQKVAQSFIGLFGLGAVLMGVSLSGLAVLSGIQTISASVKSLKG